MTCNHNHDNVLSDVIKIRVHDQHHRVGANVSLQSTLLKTLDQETARGSHCVQFYLGSRSRYQARFIDNMDRIRSTEYCDRYGKTFYVHCPNITNLARPFDHSILINSVKVIQKELNQIRGMPGSCIAHIGAVGTINNVVTNINDMSIERGKHQRMEKQFILENSAGEGTKLGKDFTEIRKIFEGIDRNTIGLCIDTQHIFGAGVNKLETHDDVVKLFDSVNEVYGRNPDVIHLNDSKVPYGKRVDRHWGLRSGYIWYHSDEGLKSLLDYCYDQDIDLILETPTSGRDLYNIRTKYMDLETIEVIK